MLVFLRCIGEAVADQGLRGLAGMVPMGNVIYDVAANAIGRYRREQREAQMRQDAERVIQAGMEQVREDAKQIAREVLAGQSEENMIQLERYLTLVPAVARQSLKRPADLAGKTIPGDFNLLDPIQLGNLLPKQLPRFNAGDPVPHAPMWRFVDLLGAGGFGEVWLAKHTFLDQQRAFKFCLEPEARERLLKHEGEVVKRVMAASASVRDGEHGIVPLVDAFLEGDTPWLAYEYVQGGDLSNIVREHADKSPEIRGKRTLEIIAHLADVIGRFHTLPQPIIHRDLKPANILIKSQGQDWLLRVTDFGISQVAAAHVIHQATVSSPSLNLGETYRGAHTPIYASPQQKRGIKPDVRDDVHALGIIGYQLLVGDLAAERPAGRWRKRLAECQLSDALLDLLESCWDDDPTERPDNAAELANRIRELLKSTTEESRFSQPALRQTPTPIQPKGSVPKIGNTIECPIYESVIMHFTWVPAGQSWRGGGLGKQGDKGFTLEKSLWCGKYPVVQWQWEAIMGNNPSHFKDRPLHEQPFHPVENVSWNDVQDFLKKVNQKKPGSGYVYRLPTEEEWEYICRGGPISKAESAFDFNFATSNTDLTPVRSNDLSSHQANFDGNIPAGLAAMGPYLERTSPVGSYLPNPLGIYDMLGNVREWTSSENTWEPKSTQFGLRRRIARGGSWNCAGTSCATGSRYGEYPFGRSNTIGFRLLAVPVEK